MKSTRQFTKRHPQSPLMATGASPTSVSSATSPGAVANGFSAAAAALNGQTTSATTGGMVAPSALHANPLESSVTVQSSTAPLHKHRSNISAAASDFHPKEEHTHYESTTYAQNQASLYGSGEQAYSHPSHEHQHNQHNHHHPFPSQHSNDPNQQAHLHQHSHDHSHDHSHSHSHSHSHDHHSHDHHHHDHHNHDHHNHDHHHHDHHSHHHNYPAVFTPPLPSWSEIFGSLAPMQKTVFTWFSAHLLIGLCVWWAGTSRDSLAIVGFSYLVMYDALGVLNIFVSDIVRTHPSFTSSNTKRPYGARRYEVVFAMATTVFLLFATMYTTKESLEHLLLEDAEGDHHTEAGLGFFGFIILCVAMGSTFLSSVSLKNHENLVRHLRRSPPTVHGFSYNVVNRARGSALNIVLSNVYSFSIVACGACVLLFHILGLASPFMDKVMAFGESAVMLYLALPTATALSKLLLQTTPDLVRTGIENRLSEIRQDPNIISIDRVHFWQNTYGKCVGTLEVQIRADADEQATLQHIYQKLEGLTSSDDGQDTYVPSELTVSILKQ